MNLRGRAWILVAALAAQSCRGSSRESAAAPAPSPAFPAMPTVGPASGHATSAVFLLHGFGADGADLRSLAEALARTLPDAVFLLPDGFEAAPGGQGAINWLAAEMLVWLPARVPLTGAPPGSGAVVRLTLSVGRKPVALVEKALVAVGSMR